MKKSIKALALAAVLGASAAVPMSANAWWGGGPWNGTGWGDMDMSFRGSGYGRGYGHPYYGGYGPYGWGGYPGYGGWGGYPGYGGWGGPWGYGGHPGYGYGVPVAPVAPAAPATAQ